jgi:hypothetical protein
VIDYTDEMTDGELIAYLSELARIESESSADMDTYAYGSH